MLTEHYKSHEKYKIMHDRYDIPH